MNIDYKANPGIGQCSPNTGKLRTGRIQEYTQGVSSPDGNVSDSELQNRDAQTPQIIDSFLNDERFGEFAIDGNLVRCSTAECRVALWQELINLFNNPEIDLIDHLVYTIVYPQNGEHGRCALIALNELKTCADHMFPEDAAKVLSVIESYVQDWRKIAQSSNEQERDAIQAGLNQIQALGIIQGDCDPNATALEFLKGNSEALEAIADSGDQEAYEALHQSLENSLQDPKEAAKLIKGLLNIATDNTEPPPPEKQMAAICLGELPGNRDLLSNLSSIFVSWAGESPDEDIQSVFDELNQSDLFEVLKNPNQSSPENLEGARGTLRGNLQKLFNIPGKNLIQALTALAFSSGENIFGQDGSEIRENALIALKEISTCEPNLKLAIEALLSAGIKNALGIYEQPANETAQQSVFAFLGMILHVYITDPGNSCILQKIDTSALSSDINLNCYQDLVRAYLANQLSGIKKQDDDPLTIFNRDIDNRIIDAAFEKLEDPETGEEALDLLCAMFDIYAAQAATTEQPLKGEGNSTSTKPEFPTFLTFSKNLCEIFSINSEAPESELPRIKEQATELLMHLVNIFPPNVIEYAGDAFDEATTSLIENASDDVVPNLLEKIMLSELHVFEEDSEETRSGMEEDFENLRNYSSNANEFQEALESIKNGIEQIRDYVFNQSNETIQDYQQRLTERYETGQDPHMWHFLVQLNKKVQWPSATDLTNILKDEYQKFKDQGILYTLVEIYKSTQDESARENIREFLIEQYVALDKEENVLAPGVLELLVRMYENSQDESICESLVEKYQDTNNPEILSALAKMYESSQDQGTCENISNFLIEQYVALDKEENVLAPGVLELLQQMYTSNPQDEGLREFLAAKEALPAAGEFPTFSPLTTLVDDSEEEDQGESLGIGNRNSDSIVQQQIAETTDAQNLLDNENDLANIPSLKGQEQPKVNNYQEQPQGQQSFWGRIGKAAGAAWNGAVEATKNFMNGMDPYVQAHLQENFIETTLDRTIQECGGGGHCLVLSVLRQIDPEGFNDAYNQKGGRFAMAAGYRMTLADWAEQNIASQGRQPTQDEQDAIRSLRNIKEDKDGVLKGEYLDANSYVGQWIAQYTERPVIIFSENSRMEPGIGNYIDEQGIPQGSVDYTRRPIPENAIVLYHSNKHYQAGL